MTQKPGFVMENSNLKISLYLYYKPKLFFIGDISEKCSNFVLGPYKHSLWFSMFSFNNITCPDSAFNAKHCPVVNIVTPHEWELVFSITNLWWCENRGTDGVLHNELYIWHMVNWMLFQFRLVLHIQIFSSESLFKEVPWWGLTQYLEVYNIKYLFVML